MIDKDPIKAKAQRLLNSMRDRAIRKGVPVVITFTDIYEMVKYAERCPCCGIIFDKTDRKKWTPNGYLTIDRFVPSLGYVKGNVVCICWRCNNLKRDATASELRRIADWMDSTHKILERQVIE